MALPWLRPQVKAVRWCKKVGNQRAEGKDTKCSFHGNGQCVHLRGSRNTPFIQTVETKYHTFPSSTKCPVRGSFCMLCDSNSCSPICIHSLVLKGLWFIVLDLVLAVTAAIHGSKESRRVLYAETVGVHTAPFPLFHKGVYDWRAHVRGSLSAHCPCDLVKTERD